MVRGIDRASTTALPSRTQLQRPCLGDRRGRARSRRDPRGNFENGARSILENLRRARPRRRLTAVH
jgi:hypothetical protein